MQMHCISRTHTISRRAPGGLPAVVFHFWIQLIQKWGSPIVSHPHSPAVVRGPAYARTCPFSAVAGCTGPRYSRLGYALMAFCRCSLFSEACRKERTLGARPQAGHVLRPSPPLSLSGEQRVLLLCCAYAPWSLGVLWAPGGCPGASISDLCAVGGGSHFGLSLGWAWLVYRRHLCGIYCGLLFLGWYCTAPW